MGKEHEVVLNLTSAAALGLLVFGAFSRATREKIWARSTKRFGTPKSEMSGRDDEPLECAHYDHDQSKPSYDTESNGRLLTLSEHLWDHINRAGRNGLTREENDWAIREIARRLRDFYGV